MPMPLDYSDSEVTIAVKDNYDFEEMRYKLSKEGMIVFSDPHSRIVIFHTKTWRVPIFQRMIGIFFVNSVKLKGE
jgi:hypothetical protein